jgi:hypothetical protein
LFAAPLHADVAALAVLHRLPLTCIGTFEVGEGLRVQGSDSADLVPHRLGWEH